MTQLFKIASERPVCHTRHTQRFRKEELNELLKYETVAFYCPQTDASWSATQSQSESEQSRIRFTSEKPLRGKRMLSPYEYRISSGPRMVRLKHGGERLMGLFQGLQAKPGRSFWMFLYTPPSGLNPS
jgi:hypothetical protein